MEILKHIGKVTSSVPQDFHVHPVLNRIIKARRKSVDEGENIDWATAEAMAFGSLLTEGTHVRLSGQVCSSGIFF
jgi:2-oxoglutarate dehydrogenase E1 component